MPRPVLSLARALLFCLAAAACGSNKDQAGAADAAAVSSAAPSAAIPDAPPSPLSVVLESKGALTFSGLEGGVWISDESKTRVAQAATAAELAAFAMPPGLPEGKGRILGVAGKVQRSVWLSYAKLKDDGKTESTPLFRLTKDQWKLISDNWSPEITAWSKNRFLSASTSSLKLKIRVIDPGSPKPPPDLPSTHLSDEPCEKTFHLDRLAALPSGEVFAAGTCKAGSTSASPRYVVIRWNQASPKEDGGAPPAASASPSAKPIATAAPATAAPSASAVASTEDAGATQGGAEVAAGAGEEEAKEPDLPPGVVDVLPGTTARAASRGLVVRSAALAYTTAIEGEGKGKPVSRLWRFDGTAWAADTPPTTSELVRGIAATLDGTVWFVTEHEIWKRAPAAAWEAVPPPTRAFPEPGPRWEFFAVWVSGDSDVWIAARHTSSTAKRDVILRLKAPKEVLRWQ